MVKFTCTSTPEGITRLNIDGPMTIYQAGELKARVLEALSSAQTLELDLSQVSEMDSAGFQILVLAKKESLRQGRCLRLIAHSPAVREVIDFYNMAAFFGDPMVIPAAEQ